MSAMAGLEPFPFGIKHGAVFGLVYLVLLHVVRPEAVPDWTLNVPMFYWRWFTADIELLAVAVVVTFPVTIGLTRGYWRLRKSDKTTE